MIDPSCQIDNFLAALKADKRLLNRVGLTQSLPESTWNSLLPTQRSSLISVMRSTRYLIRLLPAVAFLVLCVVQLEAAKKKKRMKREEIDPLRGLYSILFVMGLVIFIPIALFFYNMAMDPITPTLMINATNVVKERTLGYLSARKSRRGDSSSHES